MSKKPPSGRDTGRSYARIYPNLRKASLHERIEAAVVESGGRLLFTSGHQSGPLFLGIEDPDGYRAGVLAYVFQVNDLLTKKRRDDEHKGQIRYQGEEVWRGSEHPVGFDPAGVDVTLLLFVYEHRDVIIGLDPRLHDPLPMGRSVFFLDAEVTSAETSGWGVWEREMRRGSRKAESAPTGLETVVGFAPERFFDYLMLERQSQAMGLDAALRMRLAVRAGEVPLDFERHQLEAAFDLTSAQVLDIIQANNRLAVAVRGGVAEHHLGVQLNDGDPSVIAASPGTNDGPPDFDVTLMDGRIVTVECKNASPNRDAAGFARVEVQKTRTSKGDAASRFYPKDAFDVVAACLYGPTKTWTFKFRRTDLLLEHAKHPGRIQPIQRIDESWSDSISGALSARA